MNTLSILERFVQWVFVNTEQLKSYGYEIELNKTPTNINNPSIRLDLDSERYIARITLWNSGDCQLEIFDVASETAVMDGHIFISNDEQLNFDSALSSFINQIKPSYGDTPRDRPLMR